MDTLYCESSQLARRKIASWQKLYRAITAESTLYSVPGTLSIESCNVSPWQFAIQNPVMAIRAWWWNHCRRSTELLTCRRKSLSTVTVITCVTVSRHQICPYTCQIFNSFVTDGWTDGETHLLIHRCENVSNEYIEVRYRRKYILPKEDDMIFKRGRIIALQAF